MNIQNLIHMANQIGQFYAAQPNHEEALAGIASHIHKFWAPNMRQEMAQHVAAGGPGLLPLVQEALAGGHAWV
jgi:formate dehydrogenase subunit delta